MVEAGMVDPTAVTGIMTALAALVAALIGLWNAWQAAMLKEKVNDVEASVKSLSRPTPKAMKKTAK